MTHRVFHCICGDQFAVVAIGVMDVVLLAPQAHSHGVLVYLMACRVAHDLAAVYTPTRAESVMCGALHHSALLQHHLEHAH